MPAKARQQPLDCEGGLRLSATTYDSLYFVATEVKNSTSRYPFSTILLGIQRNQVYTKGDICH